MNSKMSMLATENRLIKEWSDSNCILLPQDVGWKSEVFAVERSFDAAVGWSELSADTTRYQYKFDNTSH